MKPTPNAHWAEKTRFGMAIALIANCFLWGGGSRFDISGLVIMQPLTILLVTALILVPGPIRWQAIGTPLLLLALFAAIMTVQLLPLPPSLWLALPGHQQFAPLLAATGTDGVWRPLSLAPDLTLGSLLGLVIPVAGLVAIASLPEKRTHQMLAVLLGAAGISALFGVLQLVGGQNSAFYRYAVTNEGAAVGLFANRNHQALLLAMTWPMLAAWVASGRTDNRQSSLTLLTAGALAIALVPLLINLGSRGGLLLGAVGLAGAIWMVWQAPPRFVGAALLVKSPRSLAAAILALILLVAAGATMFASRDEAFRRLLDTDLAGDLRFTFLPTLLQIAKAFLPFGIGMGAFDKVFRYYEPDALLKPRYFNHAHNDWLELLITGGLPAILLGIAVVAWVGRTFVAEKLWQFNSDRRIFGFLGFILVLLALMASAMDYPLRTPIHALILAFASAWLAQSRGSEASRPRN